MVTSIFSTTLLVVHAEKAKSQRVVFGLMSTSVFKKKMTAASHGDSSRLRSIIGQINSKNSLSVKMQAVKMCTCIHNRDAVKTGA
eukprot:m.356773 g.356773  ORF g.356773 m.356773 type:complete len:85 (+) comp17623_c0_seq1:2545-2799(+)